MTKIKTIVHKEELIRQCRYLSGARLDISTIVKRFALVGKTVRYLRKCDIDRSGRGYFFPKVGMIAYVKGRVIAFDNGSVELVGDIVEMELA